jgi:hypothetical protein
MPLSSPQDRLTRVITNVMVYTVTVLAITVFLMDGKDIESNWGIMRDAIKFGVSAWPIIFAAVVAQVFKTFATYKVERGIKLMELEQLVGSSSFASAVKQPIILRKVDTLALVLFVTWCISPLGSSALQRTYSTTGSMVNTTTTAYYLKTTGPNRLFGREHEFAITQDSTNRSLPDAVQDISILYMSIFSPRDVVSSPDEDEYNHPDPPWLGNGVPVGVPSRSSAYGVPMVLIDSILGNPGATGSDPSQPFQVEYTTFVTRSSFFNFTCRDWTVVSGSYFDIPTSTVTYNTTYLSADPCSAAHLNDATVFPDDSKGIDVNGNYICTQLVTAPTTTEWASSSSNSSHARFGYSDPTNSSTININSIEFASVIRAIPANDLFIAALSGNGSTHSVIKCGFQQIFIEFGVTCSRTSSSVTGVAECYYDAQIKSASQVNPVPGEGADLGYTLPQAFIQYSSPDDGQQYTTSPSKLKSQKNSKRRC